MAELQHREKQAPYTTVTILSGNIGIFTQVRKKKKFSLAPLTLNTDNHASITCNVNTNAHTYIQKQKKGVQFVINAKLHKLTCKT